MPLYSPFQARFHSDSATEWLSQRHRTNSLDRSTKSTQSSRKSLRLRDSYSSLAYGFRYYFISLIGMLFTFPSRYSFRYRSLEIFSLGAIVAPASNGISPVPPYLRIITSKTIYFRIQGYHFVSLFFPEHSANNLFQTPIKRV